MKVQVVKTYSHKEKSNPPKWVDLKKFEPTIQAELIQNRRITRIASYRYLDKKTGIEKEGRLTVTYTLN